MPRGDPLADMPLPVEGSRGSWAETGDPAYLAEAVQRAARNGDPLPQWMAKALLPLLQERRRRAGRPRAIPWEEALWVVLEVQDQRRRGLSFRQAVARLAEERRVSRATVERAYRLGRQQLARHGLRPRRLGASWVPPRQKAPNEA